MLATLAVNYGSYGYIYVLSTMGYGFRGRSTKGWYYNSGLFQYPEKPEYFPRLDLPSDKSAKIIAQVHCWLRFRQTRRALRLASQWWSPAPWSKSQSCEWAHLSRTSLWTGKTYHVSSCDRWEEVKFILYTVFTSGLAAFIVQHPLHPPSPIITSVSSPPCCFITPTCSSVRH